MKSKLTVYLVLICLSHMLVNRAARADDYEWKPLEKGKSFRGISVTGRVIPEDGALNIESARVQGRILSILKREGEKIKEGDYLYSVSSGECVSLAEEKRVAEKRSIAELITSADRREKQLGIKLVGDDCMIAATHDGVLTKRSLESGAVFNVGDTLATLLDVGHLGIEVDISEQDQGKVQVGERVSFQFSAKPEKKFSSSIQTIVPAIDLVTRSLKARLAKVFLPKDTTLDALIYGEIDNGHHENAFKIPASALVFQHNQQFVVTGGEKKPTAIPVQVISETNETASIRPLHEGGLKEGDSVATKGAIFLFQKIRNEG